MASVAVKISDGATESDGEDGWGEGKEVVILDRTAGAVSFGAHPSDASDMGNHDAGDGRLGGDNWGLLVASLANLAISYNVVSGGAKRLGTVSTVSCFAFLSFRLWISQ